MKQDDFPGLPMIGVVLAGIGVVMWVITWALFQVVMLAWRML
jgi:hypothetical protein